MEGRVTESGSQAAVQQSLRRRGSPKQRVSCANVQRTTVILSRSRSRSAFGLVHTIDDTAARSSAIGAATKGGGAMKTE